MDPETDDQSPDIGIQTLQAPFFGASSAVITTKVITASLLYLGTT
jgi:hypothetical protein